jgi:hypothetical protein
MIIFVIISKKSARDLPFYKSIVIQIKTEKMELHGVDDIFYHKKLGYFSFLVIRSPNRSLCTMPFALLSIQKGNPFGQPFQ